MRISQQALLWLGISIFAVLTLSSACMGQASSASQAASPVTTDWSNHQVIFSKPATAEQAERVQRDPRYWQQQLGQLSAKGTNGVLAPNLQPGSHPGGNQKLIRDWAQDMGSNATVGAANYPAKFAFATATANCASAPQPDFVVYSTGKHGLPGHADIVAYDNLYSGCSGTVPSVYWAYDTGFTDNTSPVFSRDGSQIALAADAGGGSSSLMLLKWALSTTESVTAPMVLSRTPNASYPSCVAPCYTSIQLVALGGGNDTDTRSSVFYDYKNDTAYVGDDAGFVHKFTPVFLGVPTELRTGGWPVQVNLGNLLSLNPALASPVHDSSSGNVFVADAGGFLYRVDPTGTVTVSGQLDFSTTNDGGPGIVQGPVVDSTFGEVYVFAPSDGSGACPGLADCAAVYELTTSFVTGDVGSEAVVGNSTVEPATPSPMYIGAFDSTYQNSVAPPTGNLYVCGGTGGSPALFQVAIHAGAFTTVTQGPTLSASPITQCSPVTDVLNASVSGGATEWIFAGVQAGGIATGCSGGCLFNFKDTPWQPSTAYTVGQEVVDSHFQIQVVSVAGTSGATAPSWATIPGHVITDGSVHWLDQGTQSVAPPAWAPNFTYVKGSKILASGNVQLATTHGTSGGTIPSFNPIPGGTTSDGTEVWTSVGAIGTASLHVAGGTSGIIFDNIVGSGTLAGASQVYFSTLSDQPCVTSGTSTGTGGCAVQASQSALQ